jgi:hypothetical protein
MPNLEQVPCQRSLVAPPRLMRVIETKRRSVFGKWENETFVLNAYHYRLAV